jgi:hypothetical protein
VARLAQTALKSRRRPDSPEEEHVWVVTAGCFAQTGTLRCSLLFDGMQPRAVPFLHLLRRNNSAAKVCEFHKLVLDCL